MKFQIYKRADGDFGWRLLAANGKKIAISGEGYKNKVDCRAGIILVKGSATAPLEDCTATPSLGAYQLSDLFRRT